MSSANVSGRFKLMGSNGQAFRITIPDKSPVAISEQTYNELKKALFDGPAPAPQEQTVAPAPQEHQAGEVAPSWNQGQEQTVTA